MFEQWICELEKTGGAEGDAEGESSGMFDDMCRQSATTDWAALADSYQPRYGGGAGDGGGGIKEAFARLKSKIKRKK